MNKLLMAMGILAVMASCKSAQPSGTALTGRLVISELCNHYVVAVEAGSLDSSLLAASWTDTKRGATYRDVFTVSSRCSFAQSGLQEGDRFTFEVNDSGTTENCAVCMAYYPVPEQTLRIRNIHKID